MVITLRGVILDQGGIGTDLDYTPLQQQLSSLQMYAASQPEQLVERLHEAEVAISTKVYLGRETLEQSPSLKLICIAATGTNNVDLETAHALGIQVCNVTAYATPSVVEHTFSLILALMRNFTAYQRDVAKGAWQCSEHFCLLDHSIAELAGKKLGIIGYGELGKAVANVGRAFGMEVLIAKSFVNSDKNDDRIELDELLSQVDVLSLHCPLTDETRDLINREKLALMKKTAIIINTARGGIVNEQALIDALRNNKLGGAAIDVLTTEPPTHNDVLLTASLANLIITPHIAWASREARQRLVNEMALNIQAFSNGQQRNAV